MNWTLAIIQAIVIAGISALISYFISKRQKSLDFSYDYRRYIVDRRKDAYAKLESLIAAINTANVFGYVLEKKETNLIMVTSTMKEMETLMRVYGFWMSPDALNSLGAVLVKFHVIESDIKSHSPFPEKERYEMYGKIISATAELEECLFTDIMSLDDVEKFRRVKAAEHKKRIENYTAILRKK